MSRGSRHSPAVLLALVAVTALAEPAAGAEDVTGLGYRVAGTIVIDEQRAVAQIESSAGEQQLYSLGDNIDGWEIVDIDPDKVTLTRSGQVVQLRLEGKPVLLGSQAPAESSEFAIVTGSSSLDFDSAFVALQKLESKPATGDSGPDYADVNRALGLAATTRIREIDGEPVASPMAVVQLSMVALASNNPFRLTVSDNNSDEIYLLPSE